MKCLPESNITSATARAAKVPLDLKGIAYREVVVGTFVGDSYITLNSSADDFDLASYNRKFKFMLSSLPSVHGGSGDAIFRGSLAAAPLHTMMLFVDTSDALTYYHVQSDDTVITLTSTVTMAVDTLYEVTVAADGTDVTLTVNTVTETLAYDGTIKTTPDAVTVSDSTYYFHGKIWELDLNGGLIAINEGTGVNIYDDADVLVGALTVTDEDEFWAGTYVDTTTLVNSLIKAADGSQTQLLGVDATLVSSEFPVENVLDEHPKKVCKTDWPAVEIEVEIASGASNTLLIGYTNAATADVRLFNYDGEEIARELVSFSGIDTYLELITDSGTSKKVVKFEYEYQYRPHSIKILLDTASTENVYVGLIQAGVLIGSNFDTDKGLVESLTDYSIQKQLSNGSFYYKKRDTVRTFKGSILVDRDPEFYVFMADIVQQFGQKPMFWSITDLASDHWLVYARVDGMPSGSHDLPTQSKISYSLIEVL